MINKIQYLGSRIELASDEVDITSSSVVYRTIFGDVKTYYKFELDGGIETSSIKRGSNYEDSVLVNEIRYVPQYQKDYMSTIVDGGDDDNPDTVYSNRIVGNSPILQFYPDNRRLGFIFEIYDISTDEAEDFETSDIWQDFLEDVVVEVSVGGHSYAVSAHLFQDYGARVTIPESFDDLSTEEGVLEFKIKITSSSMPSLVNGKEFIITDYSVNF